MLSGGPVTRVKKIFTTIDIGGYNRKSGYQSLCSEQGSVLVFALRLLAFTKLLLVFVSAIESQVIELDVLMRICINLFAAVFQVFGTECPASYQGRQNLRFYRRLQR